MWLDCLPDEYVNMYVIITQLFLVLKAIPELRLEGEGGGGGGGGGGESAELNCDLFLVHVEQNFS